MEPDEIKISFWPEASVRDGKGSGAALGEITTGLYSTLAFDLLKQLHEAQDLPMPIKEVIERYLIGAGRKVGKLQRKGYKEGESTPSFQMLTGIFLYYALGGCSTVGTALGTAFTDTVASVTGYNLTMTDHLAMTNDEHIGRMVEVTSGDNTGSVYWIWDNAAGTLSLYPQPPANIAADGIKITEAPFTHTLSEGARKSFAMHLEFLESGEEVYIDLLGCMVKALEITMEVGSETPIMIAPELVVLKFVEGAALTEPDVLEKEYFTHANLSTLTLTYNSAAVDSDLINQCDKVVVRIENDVEVRPVWNDSFPNKTKAGTLMYKVTLHTAIRNNTWYSIFSADCPNYASQYGETGYYATAIAFLVKVARSASDYWQFGFDQMRMDSESIPYKLISWEERELEMDIVFFNAPGGALENTKVVDDLHCGYYERGG